MTVAGETFLDDRRVRMRVVDVKRGRRGTVVFCRDERGRERRVAERDLAGWTAVQDRLTDRTSTPSKLLVEVANRVIGCAVDDAPGIVVVSGFEGATRLLGFQRDPNAATLSVVAGADWASDPAAQRSVVKEAMMPVFELEDGQIVQLQRAVLDVRAA